MARSFSKRGLLFSSIYLGTFVLAVAFALFSLIQDPRHSEFSGIFEILLTMPWTLAILPLVDATDYVHWYDQFAGDGLIYGLCGSLVSLPGALINAFLAYRIGRGGPANKQ